MDLSIYNLRMILHNYMSTASVSINRFFLVYDVRVCVCVCVSLYS